MNSKKEILIAITFGTLLPLLLASLMPGVANREESTVEIWVLNEGSEVKMNIDDYLVGVLLHEMPGSFELEALRAQAVAARTFALNSGTKHENSAVCTASTCCQGYISPEEYLAVGGTTDVVQKMINAVNSTDGNVLVYDGELIEATYFSSAGGRTENALDVWGADVPYLQSVESEEGDMTYITQIPLEDFCSKLDIENIDVYIDDVTYTHGGGIEFITINGKELSGKALRKILGLRSTHIELQFVADVVIVITRGYGHRVGMSQYGANAMALNGADYIEILEHYYTGATVCRYNDNIIDKVLDLG